MTWNVQNGFVFDIFNVIHTEVHRFTTAGYILVQVRTNLKLMFFKNKYSAYDMSESHKSSPPPPKKKKKKKRGKKETVNLSAQMRNVFFKCWFFFFSKIILICIHPNFIHNCVKLQINVPVSEGKMFLNVT